ncbi:hypothetical protein BJ085DRAFT_32762 [Dimargaris cristalligena]|uniref:F-box domain-containing protein n=1 Tax=Dimargaris cristalligena TaxID=215637 RepID=A0A4P9ZJS2_9FUNG|nr:hypothetical protein BJ085DRAFT_32762 [Dimargaris cristalligena]|eukprot:RKP33323.1 hypothetical protein BJ085DRAFT_32762 [Dimargaris cristalligena]
MYVEPNWPEKAQTFSGTISHLIHALLSIDNLVDWLVIARYLEHLPRPLRCLTMWLETGRLQPGQTYEALVRNRLTVAHFARLAKIRYLRFYAESPSIDTDVIIGFMAPFTGLRHLLLYVRAPDDRLCHALVSRYGHLAHLTIGRGPWNLGILFPPRSPGFQRLEALKLDCDWNSSHYQHIGNLLATDYPYLRSLSLTLDISDGTPYTPDWEMALKRFFGQPWPHIISLNLSGGHEHSDGMVTDIAPLIIRNFTRLEKLTLYLISPLPTTHALLLSNCPKLKCYTVVGHGCSFMSQVSTLDFYNPTLSYLAFSWPKCNWAAVTAIISRLPNLQELRVSLDPSDLIQQFNDEYPHILLNC